jgi:hypothetical protein
VDFKGNPDEKKQIAITYTWMGRTVLKWIFKKQDRMM